MVQIVGRDESVVKRVTCRGCASILEYKLCEVKSHHGRDYSGGADGYEWIDCPNCAHQAIIRSW